MTRIKDPKQVANTIRQIRLILISSLRGCFMTRRAAGGRAAAPRLALCECVRAWRRRRGDVGGGVCRRLRVLLRSAGTDDEDCPPVNEPKASSAGAYHSCAAGGGRRNERVQMCAPPEERLL
ncbi:hypothetical protein EYF80_056319 [Liparis tanakae]|uniref:Uncharacterized protein n=1 Tax=Liparis tanakae TaxID=230148 RepID=A0A4Z2EY69_9TELE|nr:hypothetical protein EYF80_056319 [Liparis tanakae]